MGPLSYMRSVVDRNVVIWRIPVFKCALKKPLEIHFIYFSNNEIYYIFTTCRIISACFPQSAVYFMILSLSSSNNTFS